MNVLAYALPMKGHIFPVVSTLVELRDRGHEVVFATGESALDVVRAAGLTARRATPEIDRGLEDWKATTALDALKRNAGLFARQAEPTAEDMERLIEAESPDVVLVDPLAWGAMIAAEASRLPWVATSHSPMIIPAAGARPYGARMPPARGPLGRLRDRGGVTVSDRAFGRILPRVNAVRTTRGLAPLSRATDSLMLPPLTLAYTAEPFEYTRPDRHPSVRLVGPGLWEVPADPPDWLDELDDRPLVVVSSSASYQADEILVRTALAALATEPMQVVATMPTGRLPDRVPENARLARYVPHSLLMPRAACVVCHGGLGTTQKALAYGVPLVAVPFGRDQHEVARRVRVAGAGVRLSPDRLTQARLRDSVRRALECGPGAERVADAFRRAGGAEAAASAVEELVAARRAKHAESSNATDAVTA